MGNEKIEIKTPQELVDLFQEQLEAVQEEGRDLNLQLLWSQNLFLIKLIEELTAQLGFSFKFGPVMDAASEYVSDNFDGLKAAEAQHHEFSTLMKKVYPGGGPK